MQVRETTIRELVGGERQIRVPIFQRPFSWTTDELAQLWADVIRQYEELGAGPRGSNHFMGSFVLMPDPGPFSLAVPTAVLVDGQQRLLSIMVLLVAIRDLTSRSDPTGIDRFNELYLVNRWQPPDHYLRVVPSPGDESAYSGLVRGERQDGHLLSFAYDFFAGQLEAGTAAGETLSLERLTQAVVERLSVVDITTDPGDNPYRIFESINATGRSLTQADLLRNYVFMRLPTRGRATYDDVWRPMEQQLGIAHLETLARVDLQCRGVDVATDDVYREQRARLEGMTGEDDIVAEARALASRARHLRAAIDPTDAPALIAAPLSRLARWGARSADALVVTLLESVEAGTATPEAAARALEHIESYLVRRFLTGYSTSGLTRLFIHVSQRVAGIVDAAAAVRVALSEDPAYWPIDEEVGEAVLARPFYAIGKLAQRRYILDQLEISFDAPEPVDLQDARLSIEHILPQTMSTEWREHLASLGDDPDEVHATLVHTLGNLTLTAFNGTLSNQPMERKRQIYSVSHLALNEDLREATVWGSAQIRARGGALAQRIVHRWGGPVRVARVVPGYARPNFWRPLEDLIARIPRGHWASHGDIAATVGTTEGWVGRHIRNVPGLAGAHRALVDGSAQPTGETRLAQLRAEGILGPDDRPIPERRLGREALRSLGPADASGG